MTRLISEWISDMQSTASSWNDELREMTGLDYIDIAALVSEKERSDISKEVGKHHIAVVPITSGLGTITSFAESVAAIVRAMGFKTLVTGATDVNGIYEAQARGADIICMADDDRYIALNIKTGKIGDDDIATAYGFAEILSEMAGGIRGKAAAVLGYGIIGRLMAVHLANMGAKVSVYDKDPDKEKCVLKDGHSWIGDAKKLKQYGYIADGTSEGGWLEVDMLKEDVIIVAPGIPLSLTEGAKKKLEGRYVHDLLEIGTAGMIGLAL